MSSRRNPLLVPLAAAALVAFATNSILCRLALATHSIDPALFTLIRIASGALVLAIIVIGSKGSRSFSSGSWGSAALLFSYAALFSFAYVGIPAGTGALLLFGSVQATMLVVALRDGHSFLGRQWFGLALAVVGLAYLVAPGVAAPPLDRAALMIGAGISWGFYSLRGRGVTDPIGATAGNFLRAGPMAAACAAVYFAGLRGNPEGVLLAIISGALTSGLGYVAWYAAIPSLGAARGALLQLTVPVIAALGGVLFLAEALSWRLAIATVIVLGGVYLATFFKPNATRSQDG